MTPGEYATPIWRLAGHQPRLASSEAVYRLRHSSRNPVVSTFVVRVWCEMSGAAPRWRGRIEHLQTGQQAAFEDPDCILAFVRASGAFAGGEPGPVPSSPGEPGPGA